MAGFINNHFRTLETLLKTLSKLCQPNLSPSEIGLNREFFVREVLRGHLPTYCEITSGSICDDSQKPTGQVDIVLLHPLTLRMNIGATECCMADAVFAALEVKSRFQEAKFKLAVKNLARIWRLPRPHRYTFTLGATPGPVAYLYNTLGTVLFGYKGYSAKKCVMALRNILGNRWEDRPEAVYGLDPRYLLVRDDYLQFQGDGVLQAQGPTWMERIPHKPLDGYWLVEKECLLVLVTMLTTRIQANYHLLPALGNYLQFPSSEADERPRQRPAKQQRPTIETRSRRARR